VCVCVCEHIYVHRYVCVLHTEVVKRMSEICVHARMYICMYTFMCVYYILRLSRQGHRYVCVYKCIHVCMYITFACLPHIFMSQHLAQSPLHTYTHTHTRTHRSLCTFPCRSTSLNIQLSRLRTYTHMYIHTHIHIHTGPSVHFHVTASRSTIPV
jgi:hypothetical protein